MTKLLFLMQTALKHPHVLDNEFKTLKPKSKIGERWAALIQMRFCVNTKLYTLREVGAKFGVTQERVRQIENDLIKIIFHPRIRRQLEALETYVPKDNK